jgi:pimeloyl-ACP methyl ester carboxylesterase
MPQIAKGDAMRAFGRNLRNHTKSATLAILLIFGVSGCGMSLPGSGINRSSGCVFYVDGAGGGGPLLDWGREFSAGLRMAHCGLEFRNYHWQTGLGAGADQQASVKYKRAQGAGLAAEIRVYREANPLAPVYLTGFSAGTAIAIHALEALPENQSVDSVVLLASSVSASYDLSIALRRVRDTMYVFTSESDAVLKVMVPVTGTADREYTGLSIAGICGFKQPSPENEKAARQYRKLHRLPWTVEFENTGNHGGHTDFVKPAFVQGSVAPLFAGSSGAMLALGPGR